MYYNDELLCIKSNSRFGFVPGKKYLVENGLLVDGDAFLPIFSNCGYFKNLESINSYYTHDVEFIPFEENPLKNDIQLLKFPSKQDWMECKEAALTTVGKKAVNLPDDVWKKKILLSEHSPIRELWFKVRMVIPYYVSVHLVRHHEGVNHFVQSQRNDRQDKYDRQKAPQDSMVIHEMSFNAQALLYMANKRLCKKADEKTREIMQDICKLISFNCPEFKDFLAPQCEKLGYCPEFDPCGRKITHSVARIADEWRGVEYVKIILDHVPDNLYPSAYGVNVDDVTYYAMGSGSPKPGAGSNFAKGIPEMNGGAYGFIAGGGAGKNTIKTYNGERGSGDAVFTTNSHLDKE